MSAGSDNFIDATPIELVFDGDFYTSDNTPGSTYSTALESGEVDVANNPLGPSAWWKYIPLTDGTFTADTQFATGDTYLEVFTDTFPESPVSLSNVVMLTFDDNNDTYGNKALVSLDVTAGTTYYVRYTFASSDPGNVFWLHATGPHTVAYTGPSVTFTVTNTPGIIVDVLDPPTVTLSAFQTVSVTNTPVIHQSVFDPTVTFLSYLVVPVSNTPGLQLKAFVPRIAQVVVTDFSPSNNTTIPTLLPIFRFTVSATDDFSIQVQIDDNNQFSSPINMSVSAEDPNGNFSSYVQSPVALTNNTTYYWRYRITYPDGSVVTDWKGPFVLNTDLSLSSTVYTGSWTVGLGNASPNIWFVYPGKGQPGDKVTIYGQALAADTTTVTLKDVACTVVSAATHPVTDNTIDKFIDTIGAVVTVEHDRVVFVVPNVDSPGGNIVVET